MSESLIVTIAAVLSFSLGVCLIVLVKVATAVIKLLEQLRFYFYVRTEVENQARMYTPTPIMVGKTDRK
jgi:hypothetical protein